MVKKTAIFDVVKFLCAFLVITIHTFPFIEINEQLNTFTVSAIARIAVPLFFVISAYFFFQHSKKGYLAKYATRIGSLYLIWSVIYLPFFIRNHMGESIIVMMMKYIRDFLFTGSYYHLWFLPALIFAIVSVSLLLKYLDDKKLMILAGVLYLIGCLGNIYSAFLLEIPFIGNLFSLYLNIFDTTRNGLFFGIPFVVMGYFCAKVPHNKSIQTYYIFTLMSFICFLMEVVILNAFGILESLSCMYLTLIPLIYGLLRCMQTIEMPITPMHMYLRKMSLLIYVSHILFVMICGALFPTISNLMLFIVVCIASVIFSTVVIGCSKVLPILKKLYE